MSPIILTLPGKRNASRGSSPSGRSTGTSFATGLPFFVTTTCSRFIFTSSSTARHCALNFPAAIVRILHLPNHDHSHDTMVIHQPQEGAEELPASLPRAEGPRYPSLGRTGTPASLLAGPGKPQAANPKGPG